MEITEEMIGRIVKENAEEIGIVYEILEEILEESMENKAN